MTRASLGLEHVFERLHEGAVLEGLFQEREVGIGAELGLDRLFGVTARHHDRHAPALGPEHANDLAAAAAVVVPGLLDLRRSLARALGRPVGLSGSGPSLWAIYPSLDAARDAEAAVRDAITAGRVTLPGGGEPFVHATVIVSRTEGEEAPG
jgi:hypothetical protein